MPRKKKLWKWTCGEYGTTVTVFERIPNGNIYRSIPRPTGGVVKESLGHNDRNKAMKQARDLSAKRAERDGTNGPLTVGPLFTLYLNSVAGLQSRKHEADIKRAAEMWCRFLGSNFKIKRFGPSQWESFGRLRGSGEIDARGNTVSDPEKRERIGARVIQKDLKTLRAAIFRACAEHTTDEEFLLEADPTRGLTLPAEKNPKRPRYDDGRVDALMAAAPQVRVRVGWGKQAHWVPTPLPTLLRLAADTGRRINAILCLRASDWRPGEGSNGRINWRADSDKTRKDWSSPVSAAVHDELERYRREYPLVGEALFFPSPNDPTKPVTVQLATEWLRRCEKLAKLDALPRGAWHPFRRKWATDRKHLPATDVAEVGGWTGTATLTQVYQTADEDTMEAVVSVPRRVKAVRRG